MRVAVPSDGEGLEENISAHFGRCPAFTVYDTESDDVEMVENSSRHRGGQGNPPEILDEENVDVVICSDLGRRAVRLFEELGIQVYSGARGKVKDGIEMWENDELTQATREEACEEGRRH